MIPGNVYLDNNATTLVAAECREPMLQALFEDHGNPSSKHSAGAAAQALVREARARVADLLVASPAEIVFTGSGSEAVQLALHGLLALQPEKRHVITTQVEHSSTLALLRHLELKGELRVTYLPVDDCGRLHMQALAAACTPDTALLSLAWANNETGVLFPVAEVVSLAQWHSIPVHIDAIQAVGKVTIDLSSIPVDLLSISGHKLHAPKGVGALFVRKGIKLPALIQGRQERGRRGGTENVPGIVGFGVAADMASGSLRLGHNARMAVLRDRLERGLRKVLPGVRVNGVGAERVGNTSSISFPGIEAELLLEELDRRGIQASAGSACAAGSTEPSHVLLAMGITSELALATVRFSLSRYTSASEIDRTVATVTELVGAIQGVAA